MYGDKKKKNLYILILGFKGLSYTNRLFRMFKLLNNFFKVTRLFPVTLLINVIVKEALVKRQGFILA